MCKNYSWLGLRRDGRFAQYVAVPISNLIVLPDSVSYEQAAMLKPMAMALHAMCRVHVAQTEPVINYKKSVVFLVNLPLTCYNKYREHISFPCKISGRR